MPKEIWKQIPGWPKYEVSNMGRIKSRTKEWKKEKFLITKRGSVTLSKEKYTKLFPVAYFVLLAFKGPPPGKCGNGKGQYLARHLNDIRSNNNIENLAWGTHKDNHDDAKRNGIRFWVTKHTKETKHKISQTMSRSWTPKRKLAFSTMRKKMYSEGLIKTRNQWS